jgi:hypothetical protein
MKKGKKKGPASPVSSLLSTTSLSSSSLSSTSSSLQDCACGSTLVVPIHDVAMKGRVKWTDSNTLS